jgi:hypothetical protein
VHNSCFDDAPVREADEVLSRLGTSRESASRLGRKAEEAEKVIGIHGVSVSGANRVWRYVAVSR